jgi:uncharacterized protein YuzE
MNIKMDPETGVLYLRIKGSEGAYGLVDQTVEVEEGAYLDMDSERRPLGMEFLSIEDFEAFLEKYPDGIEILDPNTSSPEASTDQAFHGLVAHG